MPKDEVATERIPAGLGCDNPLLGTPGQVSQDQLTLGNVLGVHSTSKEMAKLPAMYVHSLGKALNGGGGPLAEQKRGPNWGGRELG